MNREELAAILNGREYRDEITRAEHKAAREAGLLVVFGASDDLVEIRGAMEEEEGAYHGATISISEALTVIKPREDAGELIAEGWTPPKRFLTVKAEWCPSGFAGSWRISADKPFSKFDIMEDGELYCEGIVIDVSSGKP
jgi:hypothetical protein